MKEGGDDGAVRRALRLPYLHVTCRHLRMRGHGTATTQLGRGKGGLGGPGMTDEPLKHEKYTHGHVPAVVRHHARRTAEEAAAFLLPELRPGMRLLDVGCGSGSITRGLAERLAPGQVIGLDLSHETLAAARQDAAARDLANLPYEQGSGSDLPFP